MTGHFATISDTHLQELFDADPARGEAMTLEALGLYLDYSKNRVTDETMALLVQLAQESGLRGRIDAMFAGERINVSENRSVLHVALRMPRDAHLVVDGTDVVVEVHGSSIAWLGSPNRSAPGAGRATAGTGSATSSTWVSAVPTWAR